MSTAGAMGDDQKKKIAADCFKRGNEAMAKQVVKSGGLGIADDVAKEMLKLQGLS